jgi:subtilisin family serine protease
MPRYSTELMGTPNEFFYWVPGEMVVVVRLHRRPIPDTQELLVEQIRSQLNSLLARYSMILEPYGTYGRWSEIPTLPPVIRRSFVFGLHRQQPFIAVFFHVHHVGAYNGDPMPLALSYLQAHLEELAQSGLNVVSAMPNWLVTVAPQFHSNGGPAVPPRPAPQLDLAAADRQPLGWHISFSDTGLPFDSNDAEDVLVAVLDTAQHRDRLMNAAMRPEFRRNRLLQRLAEDLRNETGYLEIEYDRYPIISDVSTGHDFYSQDAYYKMADHGVFVTGLIRDVAPGAHIRLIRILNDYGGGDLYNIFAALTDLEVELGSGAIRRLVINLSLNIMPDIRRLPYVWFEHRQLPSTQLAGAVRVLAHIEDGLRLLFESLYAHDVLIVAAAGNDSFFPKKQGQKPRPPRIPARYDTTLSVASVNSRFVPSTFANAACMPPLNTGVATFGGDSDGKLNANGLPEAVRGVYIAPTFPGGEQNVSGWADWSGSSFATAIISGLGAHLIAQDWPLTNAISRIAAGKERRTEKLFGSSPDVPELIANVIRVQQRFEL